MRLLGSMFIGGGVAVSLLTASIEVWPVADDSGVWRTNPWIDPVTLTIEARSDRPRTTGSASDKLVSRRMS
jgi:hypothetical protein